MDLNGVGMYKNVFLKFLFFCIFMIHFNLFAQEEKNKNLGIDLISQAGFTSYSYIFSGNKSYSFDSHLIGYNIGVMALYSVIKTPIGSPVFGLGVNHVQASNTENAQIDSINSSLKLTLISTSYLAYAGFKFLPINNFTLSVLGNFGFLNSDEMKLEGKYILNGMSSKISSDFNIRNHNFYGVNLVASYEFIKNFSVGTSFVYNRHLLNFDLK